METVTVYRYALTRVFKGEQLASDTYLCDTLKEPAEFALLVRSYNEHSPLHQIVRSELVSVYEEPI